MKKTVLSIIKLSFIALSIITLSGCSQKKTPITKTGIYFDTVVSITLYENNSSELIDECFSIAEKYENLFSKTIETSDVSRINDSYNEWIEIDKETYDVIARSIEFEDLSDGHFSVMCGALTDLWDISSSNPKIPDKSDINAAINLCGKNNFTLDSDSNSIKILTKGAKIDLGAVAKGYIADKMKEYLISKGVSSGIIQLGGNVMLIGENITKEDGSYTIGIAKPFSDNSEILTSVTSTDKSIVTSGNYQRYFESDGIIYHHIIDLKTGYPASSGLNSVTIVCDNSFEADSLSTICFIYGKNNSEKLLNTLKNSRQSDYDVIFISDKNEIL